MSSLFILFSLNRRISFSVVITLLSSFQVFQLVQCQLFGTSLLDTITNAAGESNYDNNQPSPPEGVNRNIQVDGNNSSSILSEVLPLESVNDRFSDNEREMVRESNLEF